MDIDIYRMSSRELYEEFVGDMEPTDLLDEGRDRLAMRILLDHELSEEDALYAADQILNFALGWEDTLAQFDDVVDTSADETDDSFLEDPSEQAR
jgi:hypothetical protein